jgi:hypothetical protein
MKSTHKVCVWIYQVTTECTRLSSVNWLAAMTSMQRRLHPHMIIAYPTRMKNFFTTSRIGMKCVEFEADFFFCVSHDHAFHISYTYIYSQ